MDDCCGYPLFPRFLSESFVVAKERKFKNKKIYKRNEQTAQKF